MNAFGHAGDATERAPRWHEGDGRRKRILVVEDDPDLLDLTRVILEESGYRVETASNGREALEHLEDTEPCVVVLDLFMPVMSGDEFLRALRSEDDPQIASVPVVVVSAAEGPVAREARRLANAFLTKPIDVNRFLSTIERLCSE